MKTIQVKLISYLIMTGILCQLAGCDKPTADFVRPDYTPPRFSNPVAGPSFTNPSVLRTWDGWFYAYGSEVTGAEAGAALIPVMKSADLVNWTFQRAAFSSRPSWHKGWLSSPEVVEVNRQAYLYYTFGDVDDPTVCVGIATAFNPAGPYVNREDLEEMGDMPGNLLDADSIHIADPRHPFYFQDGEKGSKYLFWTSGNAGEQSGVYCLQLTENGLRVPDWETTQKIASGTLEGVVIHQQGAVYYLFGTRVENGTSRIVVGRSDRLQGPYVDRDGKDLNDDTAGSTFIEGSATFVNPGHNTRIFTDKNAEDWVLFHAVDARENTADDEAEQRPLLLAKVTWSHGWPGVVAEYLSDEEVTGPNFY